MALKEKPYTYDDFIGESILTVANSCPGFVNGDFDAWIKECAFWFLYTVDHPRTKDQPCFVRGLFATKLAERHKMKMLHAHAVLDHAIKEYRS